MRACAARVAAAVSAVITACALGGCASEQPSPAGSTSGPPTSTPARESALERQIRTALGEHPLATATVACPADETWKPRTTRACVILTSWNDAEVSTSRVPVTKKPDGSYDWTMRLAG